jgi:hypothetical protein
MEVEARPFPLFTEIDLTDAFNRERVSRARASALAAAGGDRLREIDSRCAARILAGACSVWRQIALLSVGIDVAQPRIRKFAAMLGSAANLMRNQSNPVTVLQMVSAPL